MSVRDLINNINGNDTVGDNIIKSLNESVKVNKRAKLTEARSHKEANEKASPRNTDKYVGSAWGSDKVKRNRVRGKEQALRNGSNTSRENEIIDHLEDDNKAFSTIARQSNEYLNFEKRPNKYSSEYKRNKDNIKTSTDLKNDMLNDDRLSKEKKAELSTEWDNHINDLKAKNKNLIDLKNNRLAKKQETNESAKTITLRPTSTKLTEAESIELKDEYTIGDLDDLVWSGARDRWSEMPDDVKEMLLDLWLDSAGYIDGIIPTTTDFNNFIWFEADDILEDMGYDINNGYVMKDENIEESCGTKKKTNESVSKLRNFKVKGNQKN